MTETLNLCCWHAWLQAELPSQQDMKLSGKNGFMPYRATADLIRSSLNGYVRCGGGGREGPACYIAMHARRLACLIHAQCPPGMVLQPMHGADGMYVVCLCCSQATSHEHRGRAPEPHA